MICGSRRHPRAYTLLEILLVLAILTAAVFGVLRFFRGNAVQAAVQKEQTNLAALVNGVQGMFSAQGSYAGVSSQVVAAQHISGVPETSSGTGIVSAFGGAVTVQPATVQVANDAFQVVYNNLSTSQCVSLIPAVAGNAYAITIGSSTASVVSQSAVGTGQITDPSQVSSQCAQAPFGSSTGSVTLTYYNPKQGAGPIAGAPACTTACSPQTQSQTLSCPGAEVGAIQQTRQGTCVGAPCPALTWGAWTTTASSCEAAPVPPGPPTTPTPPTPSCSPTTEYQVLACPAGDVGRIWQQNSVTCVGGVPTSSGWSTISNDCAPPSSNPTTTTGCTTHIVTGTQACPAGEGGQITTQQNVTCDASGNPVYGPVTPVSNTCQASCALTGTCCTVGSKTGPQQTVTCSPGQYGQIIDGTTEYSTCSSATASPVWGSPQVTSTSGSCTACPAPVSTTGSCAAGQYGHTTSTTSYNCSGAPITLPAPTTTSSSTCNACPAPSTTTSTSTTTQPASAACPAGDTGSDTWNEVYDVTTTTTTSYNCTPSPATLPAPTVTSSTGAPVDTGARQGEVNTCVASAPSATGNGCTAIGALQYSSTGPVSIASNPGTGTTVIKSCTCKVTVSYGGSTQQIMVTTSSFSSGGGTYYGYNAQTFTVGGGSFLFGVMINASQGTYGGNSYWNSTCQGSVLLPNGSNYP